MEINGFDLDVREEGVLVEKHRATPSVSYVQPVREELVVQIFNLLVQGNNVPLSGNLFFNREDLDSSCICSASFERKSGLARCYRRNILERVMRASVHLPHDILRRPFERPPCVVLR